MFIEIVFAQSGGENATEAITTAKAGILQVIWGYISLVFGNIPFFITGILVLIISVYSIRFINKRVVKAIIAARGQEFSQENIILIKRIISGFILTVGIIFALQISKLVDTSWLLGALGFGVGFALKDLINNFFSGLIILTQNEMKIGDIIKVQDLTGTIVDIQTRASILQLFDGTKVTVPNGLLLAEKVVSYTANPFRRIEIVIGVSFDSDIEKAKQIALETMKAHPEIEQTPDASVLVTELLDSAIKMSCRFWVKSRGVSWIKIRSTLIGQIKDNLRKNNIVIPFPIMTLEGTSEHPVFLGR